MICIVLAGGRGIRLSPLTNEIPKPLILFKKKPLIDFTIEILYEKFDKIVVVVDYLAEMIQSHFLKSKYSPKIIIVHQGPEMKGTLGALKSAEKFITSEFLVICSDNLYDPKDIDKLLLQPNSFLIKKVTKDIRLRQYKEAKISLITEPNWYYLEAGAWYLDKEFVNAKPVLVDGTNEFGIPHTIFSDYQKNKSKYRVVFANFWYPVGTHWELDYVNKNLFNPL